MGMGEEERMSALKERMNGRYRLVERVGLLFSWWQFGEGGESDDNF